MAAISPNCRRASTSRWPAGATPRTISPNTERGLILVSRDAGGVETAIVPDEHWVLPQKVTTGGTLEESAIYDYRTQQPATVTDANGYHTGYTYTPLGMLHTVVRSGPAQDDQLGDTPDQPGIVYAYGLTEYHDSPDKARRPVWVRARTRGCSIIGPLVTMRTCCPRTRPGRSPSAGTTPTASTGSSNPASAVSALR